ncbi:MAG: hypothetical protein JSV09_11530 [Thermoplasmata archaeon]|nr:MAG: hypothetical protein JSV09_11530 [Thermoplasmata archaeon]
MVKLKFDLKELEDDKKRNFEERLKFIDLYVQWLKKTPNRVWSKQQKEMIEKANKKGKKS